MPKSQESSAQENSAQEKQEPEATEAKFQESSARKQEFGGPPISELSSEMQSLKIASSEEQRLGDPLKEDLCNSSNNMLKFQEPSAQEKQESGASKRARSEDQRPQEDSEDLPACRSSNNMLKFQEPSAEEKHEEFGASKRAHNEEQRLIIQGDSKEDLPDPSAQEKPESDGTESKQEKQESEARIYELTSQLQHLKNEKQISEARIYELTSQVQNLEKEKQEFSQEMQESEARIYDLSSQLQSLNEKKQESEDRIYELTSQLQNLMKEKQFSEAKIYELTSQLKKENEALTSELQNLKRAHGEVQRQGKTLAYDLSEYRSSNEKLRRRMDEIEATNAVQNPGNTYSDSSATPALLNAMITRVREAALSFANVFEPYVEAWKYPYIFARRRHRQFAIASTVCRILFTGFEIEDFGMNEGYCTVARDPAELRNQAFQTYLLFRELNVQNMFEDSSFHKFCSVKWSKLRMPGVLQESVTESFSKLAKQVWLIHKVAFSFYPSPATVLRFSDGTAFDPRFMESVTVDEEDGFEIEQFVGFMVIPGFRVRDQAFKSYVYLKLLKLHVPGILGLTYSY